jgi:hypothetical protein
LDAAQEAEIRRWMTRLKPSSAKVSIPGLGYRGFILYGDDAIRFYRGHVLVDSEADTAQWASADREVERWLLETGKAVIGALLYKTVLREISND